MGFVYKIRLAHGELAKVLLSKHCDHIYQIDWIHVPPKFRGKGVSNQLMQRVIADADKFSIDLKLVARACAGLSQKTLEDWYETYGFKKIGRDPQFGGTKMKRTRNKIQ